MVQPINKRIQFVYRIRKNGRRPSGWPLDGAGIPLRITRMFPLKLADKKLEHIEAADKTKERDVSCMTEMMRLFECYERNEFDRAHCKAEIDKLNNCYEKFSKLNAVNK